MSTAPLRVATYTRVVSSRDRAELARRYRRLGAAVAGCSGAVLVVEESDAGPTAALGRPGLSRLYHAARARRFEVLVVEHVGRLSPSPAEAQRIVAAFGALGVRVRPLGKQHRRLIAAGTAAGIVKLIGR